VHTEKSFGVRKDEPFEIGGHPVQGFIDRIDFLDGFWYVTDYNTDKKSPEKDSFILHRHPQFTIYSYAFRKVFGELEKSILYYHLRSGRVFKTHRSEKDYDYLKRLLDEVAEGIEKEVFVPFYGFHCNFCDYKTACEKYSISHHGGPRIDEKGKIKKDDLFEGWDYNIPDWMEIQSERE
jgi:CRISPR/Cas system-associated exonuclease Cas4 (RecB family)